MGRTPQYETYIDWYGINGLALGTGTWEPYPDVGTPPTVSRSTDQVYYGDYSYKIEYAASPGEAITTGLNVFPRYGADTRYSLWIHTTISNLTFYVENVNSTVNFVRSGLTTGQWIQVDLDDAAAHAVNGSGDPTYLGIYPTVAGAGTVYVGMIQVNSVPTGPSIDEDMTCYNLITRNVPKITYGKDEGRDLDEIRSGVSSVLLNNESGLFTPPGGYADYPVNRQLVIRTLTDTGYYTNSFVGLTEDYKINGSLNDQSVFMSAVDKLSRLEDVDVVTGLYESIRTGDAIKVILDAAGVDYDADDIDNGGTTLQWWSYNGKALAGIQEIVKAEGPPSLYSMSGTGTFVFEDRHHRVRPTYDSTPLYTVVACRDDIVDASTEFAFMEESDLDSGWQTIKNRVNVKSTSSGPADDISEIWKAPNKRYTWSGVKTFSADVDGFIDGVRPVAGALVPPDGIVAEPIDTDYITTIVPEDADYVVEYGSVVLTSYKSSGSKVEIVLTAQGEASIRDLRFRGRSIQFDESTREVNDEESQNFWKIRPVDYDAGNACENDAEDVALWILKKNRAPRPKATIVIKNESEFEMDAIARTRLSKVISVQAPTHWGVDTEFNIEGMEHTLGQMGGDHELRLLAEQDVPVTFTPNVFTFGSAGPGFDFGVFGSGTVEALSDGLYLPGVSGSYASTTDKAQLDITGDIDLRAYIRPATWTPVATQNIMAKAVVTGNQRSYYLRLTTTGAIQLLWSTDGTSPGLLSATSTVAATPGTGSKLAVRATMDVNDGSGNRVINFYTAPSMDGPWTPLGATVTTAGTTSIFSSTAPLEAGSGSLGTSDLFVGTIYALEARSGIGGTVVADPDFTLASPARTTFDDNVGNTWTVNGSAYFSNQVFIIGRSALDGTNEIWY